MLNENYEAQSYILALDIYAHTYPRMVKEYVTLDDERARYHFWGFIKGYMAGINGEEWVSGTVQENVDKFFRVFGEYDYHHTLLQQRRKFMDERSDQLTLF